MMPNPTGSLARWGLLLTLPSLVLSIAAGGCQREATSREAPAQADSPTAGKLLAQLAEKYKGLSSYEDAGELHLSLEAQDGQKADLPPIPFSVALERPRKVRIHVLGASIVADGKWLRASADSLENQVLVQPCPDSLSGRTLFADPMLLEASRGQIGAALPQLVLLLEDDPMGFLAGDGRPRKLADAELQGETCHRVAVDTPQGPSVFWISASDGLLRKFEFPSEALKKKYDVAKCSLWAEFKGARGDTSIADAAFQFAVPEGAKLLKRFFPPPPAPPSPLLAKTPEDFSFVDLAGAAVTRDSLKDKIVVLDMWATWCGWCFKGFPNLEQVYQKYKDNGNVVILAVNKDAPAVSDAKVRGSFESAQLTIPIVRDAQQTSDKVFQVQVLPTMVIFGADGTIQDFHVGYDPNLAEALGEKIDKLLAGENIAQQEIEEHERKQQEYEGQVADALADDNADGEQAEIARKDASAN